MTGLWGELGVWLVRAALVAMFVMFVWAWVSTRGGAADE